MRRRPRRKSTGARRNALGIWTFSLESSSL